MILQDKDHTIEVTNEPDHKLGAADNKQPFKLSYFENSEYRPSSIHGVRVLKDEAEISSAIIMGHGGPTGIHDRSCLIKNNDLYICCGDSLYSLTLPELSLKWRLNADQSTCFAVYAFGDHILTHGELAISCIDHDGNLKWEFTARDIFVRLDGKDAIYMEDQKIYLTDFEGYQYHLDKNGVLLDERPPQST